MLPYARCFRTAREITRLPLGLVRCATNAASVPRVASESRFRSSPATSTPNRRWISRSEQRPGQRVEPHRRRRTAPRRADVQQLVPPGGRGQERAQVIGDRREVGAAWRARAVRRARATAGPCRCTGPRAEPEPGQSRAVASARRLHPAGQRRRTSPKPLDGPGMAAASRRTPARRLPAAVPARPRPGTRKLSRGQREPQRHVAAVRPRTGSAGGGRPPGPPAGSARPAGRR